MADNQRYFTLLTDKGRYKIAKAAADKGEVKFSHFAIGDGNGQETNSLPSANALVHEVWRGQLDSVTTDPKNPAAVIINAIIPHNVGGWWMREFGLFDIEGDMLAVVKPAPNYKATSAEGQLEDVFYEFQLVIGEQAQVVVLVDPSILWATREFVETRRIPAQQLANTPWLPIISLTQKTPPTKPAIGDIYVVPDDGKGEWSDKASQIAEWNGSKWLFSSTKDGHGIGLPDGSIYIKIAGKYVLLTDILDKRYSQMVAPPADTFYVVGPSGSDKNSGLKPTPDEGFATIQGAIDALSDRYITQGTITLKIADGTYEGIIINSSLVANWRLVGNTGNPSAVRLNGTDPTKQNVRGLIVASSTNVKARGLTFSGYDGGAATSGGSLEIRDCNVISPAAKSDSAVAFACYGGSLRVFGKIRISGSFYSVFIADQCGSMRVGETFSNGIDPTEITYQNVTCSAANFSVQNSGSITITSPVVKFIGVPNGAAFGCSFNGTIMSVGGGANFIPGTRPGWTGTGGQFV